MEYVHSPVAVNATLQCSVNSSQLTWEVDHLLFNGEDSTILESRGIYLVGKMTTLTGLTLSSVSVAGHIDVNNNTLVCCTSLENRQTRSSCTTVIIYGKTSLAPIIISIKAMQLLIAAN